MRLLWNNPLMYILFIQMYDKNETKENQMILNIQPTLIPQENALENVI